MNVLQEPGFWSVIIATIALVLSQLPPIRELIKGIDISFSIPEQISIWHFLGNIQIILLVDIANTGGRRVSIARLECLLIDDNNKVWLLPAQSYISRQPPSQPNNPPPEYLMTRISIKPADNWNETVRFNRLWTETEEEEINEIVLEFTNDIQSQLPSEILVEANQESAERAIQFFKRKFDLHKGNYKLLIAARDDDEKLIGVRGFGFTLYESHIHALTSHADQYKFGAGIYYPITNPANSAWVRVQPLMDKKQVKEVYLKYRPQ